MMKTFKKTFSSVPFPSKDLLNVTICGGSGAIAYSLIPMIGNGLVFGKDQKLALTIYDRPESAAYTLGNILEIEDCVFPNLESVKETILPQKALNKADVVIFLGSAHV